MTWTAFAILAMFRYHLNVDIYKIHDTLVNFAKTSADAITSD